MPAIGLKREKHVGKVLVLGKDNRSFLAVVRSLGRKNISVHVGWCPPDSSALSSKYVAEVHTIPPYSPHDDFWKRSLIGILQQEQFDLVIPCNDSTLFPLQNHKADLEPYGRIYLLNEHAFSVVFDKLKVNELARSVGIPLPREISISKPTEASTILCEFDFPVVLKPRTSYNLKSPSRKNNVRKAYHAAELNTCLEYLLAQGDILAQENFIGTGVGVEVLADRGTVLFAFQHVRIHEPLRGGGSSYRKSVCVDPELLAASSMLMKALNYTGVAMIEFKVNFKTGAWVLIEINGRFWGSLPLAVAAGADFPYYLYQLLVDGRRVFPQDYKKGLYCRNLLKDLQWIRHNLKADRLDPTLATLPLMHLTKEVMNILTFKERSDTFTVDDPKPGFIELANSLYRLMEVVLNKISLYLLALRPIRKRYTYKARRALKKAKTVLFVCKGNICRSPFAQYYTNILCSNSSIKAMSCGYYPENGRACPPQAIDAAKKIGVDLTSHRSSVVSEDIIRQAEVIFTFDEENRKVLIRRYPFIRHRIYWLGLLAEQGPITIRDPYGGDITDFESVYQNIIGVLNCATNSVDSMLWASADDKCECEL